MSKKIVIRLLGVLQTALSTTFVYLPNSFASSRKAPRAERDGLVLSTTTLLPLSKASLATCQI